MRLKPSDPLQGAMALVLALIGLGAFFLLLRESVGRVPDKPVGQEASFISAE